MKSHDSIMSPVNELSIHDGADLSPPPPSTKNAAQENPWLSISDTPSSKVAKRNNEVVLGKDSSLSQKSKMTLKKQMAKAAGTQEKEVDDATLEITTQDALVLKKESAVVQNGRNKKKKKKNIGKDKEALPVDDDSSEENSELDEQEAALNKTRKGPKAFEQRELVARAFAGDNVVRVCIQICHLGALLIPPCLQQFEEAKRREMESDAPKEVDTTLPGWVHRYSIGSLTLELIVFLSDRVHGVAVELRKRRKSRTSSKKLPVLTPSLERIMARRTLSSQRRGIKRRRNSPRRTFHTLTRAKRNTRRAWIRLWEANGIRALASREGLCRKLLKR